MALRSSSSNSGTSGLPSVPVPTGVAANDIVIVIQANDGATNPTTPSGFTSLAASTSFGPDGQSASIAWKLATGADTGSYSWSGTAPSPPWASQGYAFSGRDTGNPPVISTLKTQATATNTPWSVSTNAVTVISGDDMLYIGIPDPSTAGTDTLTTVPSGYTLIANTVQTLAIIGSANEDNNTTAGSTTATGTFTGTATAGWGAWLVRVPASGGAPSLPPDLIMAPPHR